MNAIAVFSSSNKMVGHIPEPVAKILFPRTKCWKILEIKVEISGEKRSSPEGAWVLGDSVEIPATFYIYGARIHKLHVRKVIKNVHAGQG